MRNAVITRVLAASAVLLLAAGAASAADPENDRGFYAGGGLGQFNVKIDNPAGVVDAIQQLDDSDTAWKVFAGYRINKYVAVEGDYIDFGRAQDRFETAGSSGDYSIEFSGLAPYLVLSAPIGPVELEGRAGYYFYDVKTSADLDNPGGNVFHSSDKGSDFVYGVGLGLTMFERLNAKLEYEVIDVKGTNSANAFWLSGSWRF